MGIITPKKIDFGPTDLSLGKGPPSGLVPVGESGIYLTPDEPADVFDCNRYPDSIYCGGNPLSITPIGIDANLEIDNCGATVTATPIVAFVKLPPLNVSYRLPGECRNEYEKTRTGKKPSASPPPEGESYPTADMNQWDIDDNETVYAFIGGTSARISVPYKLCGGGEVKNSVVNVYGASDFRCPGVQITIAGNPAPSEVSCTSSWDADQVLAAGTYNSSRECHDPPTADQNISGHYESIAAFNSRRVVEYWIGTDGRVAYTHDRRSGSTEATSPTDNSVPRPWSLIEVGVHGSYVSIHKGKWGILKKHHAIAPNVNHMDESDDGMEAERYRTFKQRKCLHVKKLNCETILPNPNYQLPPPPPPPPPKKECCVSCCSPSQQQEQKDYTALLQQILKECQKANKSIGVFPQEIYLYDSDENQRGAQGKTEKIPDIASSVRKIVDRIEVALKIAGIEEFPVSVPSSLISKDEGWLGNLIPNFNLQVKNQVTLMGWFVERFDEIMGQWEIPIEIKDSDPTKPGDQPSGIKLPNIAEAIAEMTGMLFQISVNSETLINMSARTLTEAGLTRQQAFKNYTYSQAIASHLAFEFREKSHKVPFLFNPGKESLDEFLQEKEVDVSGIEYVDKIDLKANLADLLQSAAIIRAVFWRRLNPSGDMAKQMFDLIKDQKTNSDAIQTPKDSTGKSDFDRFLEDVEIGFTNETGISDSNKPYGREYDQRPRLKKIGTDQAAVDEGAS